MITNTNDATYQLNGLSTDEKPTFGVGNGSLFLEIDTGKVFCFDEEHKTWIEL